MSIHVCVHTCVYIQMIRGVHMLWWIPSVCAECIYIYLHIQVHICIYISIHIRTQAQCIYSVCHKVYVYIYIKRKVYVYTYISIDIRTQTQGMEDIRCSVCVHMLQCLCAYGSTDLKHVPHVILRIHVRARILANSVSADTELLQHMQHRLTVPQHRHWHTNTHVWTQT